VSTFTIGATTATFDAVESISDKASSEGLEEITVGLLFASPFDWGAFFSLRSWKVTQRAIPGGNNVYVDIGGGAGVGSLAIDNLDPHDAILIGESINRTEIEPGTLRTKAAATFLITA
jgi:hypothetical protein